jgi:GNAT superfamily N-acetyltransferase
MPEIREVAEQQWQLLRDVRLLALRQDPEAFGSTYAREVAFGEDEWRARLRGAGRWWLARRDGEVAGIVSGGREPGAPAHERAVYALWVAPAGRRTGVGAELVRAVADWARSDGAAALSLRVAAGNDGARRLYLRLGFVPAPARPLPHEAPGRCEERLVLDLTASRG